MGYIAVLSDSQQLAIANSGTQTQISSTIATPGQQQSQSSSFNTGKWNGKPKLFRLGQEFVLQIDVTGDAFYVLIRPNSIATIPAPAALHNYPQVALTEVADTNPKTMPPMPSMPTMPPMKMGNMSMDINSMSMQMGNMSLDFGNQNKTTTVKQFCSQCGQEARTGDRFCRSCGHELAL
ncbi:MAG: zinc ribbon domain-containing protein [Cyanobacteria bacterium J06623_7]